MKKILTVLLVLTLSVAGLFAADSFTAINSTITLTASIAKQEPTFDFIGSMNSDLSDSVTADTTTDTLTTGKNPADEDIVAYFRLKQNNKSRHDGNLTVTVTGNEFKENTNNSIMSGKPTIVTNTKMTDTEALSLSGISASENIYSVTLNYSNNKPQATIDDVFTLSYKWAQTASLPAGNYSAVVSINIEQK